MASYKTKAEVVSVLRKQLSVNPKQALKALVFLFNKQTEDEQRYGHTRHFNKVGFNHNDSRYLTYLAKKFIAGRSLTNSEIQNLYIRIPKYAGQLVNHSLVVGKIRKEKGLYVW